MQFLTIKFINLKEMIKSVRAPKSFLNKKAQGIIQKEIKIHYLFHFLSGDFGRNTCADKNCFYFFLKSHESHIKFLYNKELFTKKHFFV